MPSLVDVSIVIGALFAGAAGLQHFYDRYAKNGFYQRTMAASREGLAALRTELAALPSRLKLPEFDAAKIGAQIGAQVAPAMQNATAALAEPLANALVVTVQTGFSQMTGALVEVFAKQGFSEMAKVSNASRAESAAAKVGAKKFLAQIAGQAHPIAGLAAGAAMTVIPDEYTELAAEKLYEFLDANPGVLAKLNGMARSVSIGGSRSELPR